jgi:hypothetical protein
LQPQRGAVLAHGVDQRAIALEQHAIRLVVVQLDLAHQRVETAQDVALQTRVRRLGQRLLVLRALVALRRLEAQRREPRRRLDALLQRLVAPVDILGQRQVRAASPTARAAL